MNLTGGPVMRDTGFDKYSTFESASYDRPAGAGNQQHPFAAISRFLSIEI